MAIEEAGGTVIGPTAHVSEALELLEQHDVSGAILDVNLADRNVTPVAMLLIRRLVPLVFHTGVGLPDELAALHPDLIVCTKPTSPDRLIRHLQRQMKTA